MLSQLREAALLLHERLARLPDFLHVINELVLICLFIVILDWLLLNFGLIIGSFTTASLQRGS